MDYKIGVIFEIRFSFELDSNKNISISWKYTRIIWSLFISIKYFIEENANTVIKGYS